MPTKPPSMMTPEEYRQYTSGGTTTATPSQPTRQPQAQPSNYSWLRGMQRSYWEQPANLVKQYNAIKSLPPGVQPPSWLNTGVIDAAYRTMAAVNQGLPPHTWKPMAEGDPARSLFAQIPAPEVENWWEVTSPQPEQANVYQQQSAPVEDPNAPWYAKLVGRILNNPKATMGITFAANAVPGALGTAATGGPAGVVQAGAQVASAYALGAGIGGAAETSALDRQVY